MLIIDILNYISLPIEVIGFTLTVIELYREDIADRIENFIDKSESMIKNFAKVFILRSIKVFGILSTSILIITFVINFFFFIKNDRTPIQGGIRSRSVPGTGVIEDIENGRKSFMIEAKEFFISYFLPLLEILLYVVLTVLGSWLFLLFLSLSIRFLNKLSNGKALGSIGLILSFVGLVIEVLT